MKLWLETAVPRIFAVKCVGIIYFDDFSTLDFTSHNSHDQTTLN